MRKSLPSWSKRTRTKEENTVFSVPTRRTSEADPGPRYRGDIFLEARLMEGGALLAFLALE